jgi:hypothetical protein
MRPIPMALTRRMRTLVSSGCISSRHRSVFAKARSSFAFSIPSWYQRFACPIASPFSCSTICVVCSAQVLLSLLRKELDLLDAFAVINDIQPPLAPPKSEGGRGGGGGRGRGRGGGGGGGGGRGRGRGRGSITDAVAAAPPPKAGSGSAKGSQKSFSFDEARAEVDENTKPAALNIAPLPPRHFGPPHTLRNAMRS